MTKDVKSYIKRFCDKNDISSYLVLDNRGICTYEIPVPEGGIDGHKGDAVIFSRIKGLELNA